MFRFGIAERLRLATASEEVYRSLTESLLPPAV
jgi:hypothetical protein